MKEYTIRAFRQIEASGKKGIWEAHWGCAVIAGALLVEENLIGEDARASVTALLDSLLTSHAGFQGEATEDRNPIPFEVFAETLLAELAHHAEVPRELGHDVIYSAYVLKALNRFGITPWGSLLDSVTMLIRKIKAAGPGWITVNGKNEIRTLDGAEGETEVDYWTIFSNFDRPMPMEAGDMQLGHLLTHGHAIGMLRDCANQELTADFDLAYRKRLRGLRLANDDQKDKSPLLRRKIDPRTNVYWILAESLGNMGGHALKYAYSFLDLRRNHVSAADIEAYSRIVWPKEPI